MNTSDENSYFNEFKDFVKSTREEYEDENFKYTCSFSEIKNLHYETWTYDFKDKEAEKSVFKSIILEVIYENPNRVLLHLFGYRNAIPKGIIVLLNIEKDFTQEIMEVLNNYPNVENVYPKLEQDKFPAPEWLVYPNIPCGSIGWRMGYGENYLETLMRVDIDGQLFRTYFSEPSNWNPNIKFYEYVGSKKAFYAIGWSDKGLPKYVLKKENPLALGDEFTFKLLNEKFRIDHIHHDSLKDAYNYSKQSADEGEADWDKLEYSVLLNILYFKILEDMSLIQMLLKTGDRELSIETDDVFWSEKEEILSLALMEVRNEMERLFEHNDDIDWLYTEFLKIAPYDFEPVAENNIVNRNSTIYMIFEQTYVDAELYVRDSNLSEKQESKYQIGKIIQERGFVDATSKIGKMTTTHRFAILSNHMADLSEFETETDWNLHTANANSQFKILDVYKHENKTQILLLHLIEGFEIIFEDDSTIQSEFVEISREIFENSFQDEVIASVNGPDWLERCESPVGLNDDDEFWEIQE